MSMSHSRFKHPLQPISSKLMVFERLLQLFPKDRFRFGLKSFPGSCQSLYMDAIRDLFLRN